MIRRAALPDLPRFDPDAFHRAERLVLRVRDDGMVELRIDWDLSGDQHDPPRSHTLLLLPSEAWNLGAMLEGASEDSPGVAVATKSPRTALYRIQEPA